LAARELAGAAWNSTFMTRSSTESGAQSLAQGHDPTQPVVTPARLHLPYLDGIRALMALYVVHNHILEQLGIVRGPFRLAPKELLRALYYGHYCVAVFIVLSGYCLMLPVLRDGGTLRGGLLTFFRRRARRILPPYYFTLAFCALLIGLRFAVLHDVLPDARNPKIWLSHALLIHDLLSINHVYGINGALWSVATEWQIYFFFPLLLLPLWKRRGDGAALLAGFGAGLAIFGARPALLYACPWFIGLFALGLVAAHRSLNPKDSFARLPWQWLGLALLALTYLSVRLVPSLSWYEIASRYRTQGGGAFLGLAPLADIGVGLATCCFLMHGTRATLAGHPSKFLRVCSWRPLVWIGSFSYSLYLVHLPMLEAAHGLLRRLHAPFLAEYAVLVLVFLPICVAFSFGFWHFAERPFLSSLSGARKRLPETG